MKVKLSIITAVAALVGGLALPVATMAATPEFQLQPFEFVGTADQCGGTAGTDTVTAKWDNNTGNDSPSILLAKDGDTANCAAAGVDIVTDLEGEEVSNLTTLGFDYLDGGHCGAGAPRFNIQSGDKVAFLGCAGGTQTSLGNGWTHVVFDQDQIEAALTTAGINSTDTLDDLYIIFDEGTDTAVSGTIGTAGSINIDNISVNEDTVGSATSPMTKDDCKNGGWKNFNPKFKNQGDCVSFVATKGKNQPSGKTMEDMNHSKDEDED